MAGTIQAGSFKHMVEPNISRGDVALFIDWENFKISLAVGNRNPNLSSLKEEVSNLGRVVVAKAYADWVTRAPELRGASQFFNDPPSLYAAGIEPVFVPTRIPSSQASSANGMRTYRVKNSVDVKMTADCIECAHSYPNIATFVLVSGDSDFLHVVNALRTMGKHVVIVGVSWSTSRRLADQVDSLLLYDKDVDPIAPQPAVLPQHVNRPAAQDEAPELAQVISAIEDIIREERAADSNPLLTSIKQRLMRRYPSFDEKKLGFSGFKKLMARAAEVGNIKLIHAGLVDWAIMADEETPEGTTEESPSGVTARPSRRRGGRRRGGQRDADGTETEETTVDAEDADSSDDYVETLEETAATDFDIYGVMAPGPSRVLDFNDPNTVPDFVEPAEDSEPAEEAPVAEPVEGPQEEIPPQDVFADDAELAEAVRAALSSMALPDEPEDGQNPERVSDLIVMTDHLEHHHGVTHVTFNFLVAEVSTALEQGLEAGNEQIAGRWTGAGTRDYVGKVLRALADGGFFRRARRTWRDEETGRRRQRQTFNLDRDNELVGRMLIARLGPAAGAAPPDEPSVNGVSPPVALDDSEELQSSDEAQPVNEQLALVDSDTTADADAEADSEPEPDPVPEPQPSAEGEGQGQGEAVTEDYEDEPQPRSTRRRRPFSSRLLRS